jgi:hypothetical protein
MLGKKGDRRKEQREITFTPLHSGKYRCNQPKPGIGIVGDPRRVRLSYLRSLNPPVIKNHEVPQNNGLTHTKILPEAVVDVLGRATCPNKRCNRSLFNVRGGHNRCQSCFTEFKAILTGYLGAERDPGRDVVCPYCNRKNYYVSQGVKKCDYIDCRQQFVVF